MSDSSTRPTRLYELLADRALVGLTAAEEAELATLLAQHPDEDAESFDRAAAAAQLALLGGKLDPLPTHLAAKIESAALPKLASGAAPLHPSSNVRELPARRDPLRFAGWIAAAACLLIAVGVTVFRKPQIEQVATVTPPSSSATTTAAPPTTNAVPAKSAAQLRDELLADQRSLKIAWSPTKDPGGANASGDVVFNVAEQRGYMRFHGLAANDPAAHQYQLWIFDKAQDKRYPIDGGVFDVASNGDVIVPIQAKIRVTDPTLFAVTVEAPGGVVVSKREHIVVTAARS